MVARAAQGAGGGAGQRMTPVAGAAAAEPARPHFTPALLVLFVASGAAALIYEVVWFHLLRLVVGGSAISLGFLLGSFMGGMGLGSWLLPRLLPARLHPLRVYAALELRTVLHNMFRAH